MNDTPGWASPGSAPSDGQQPGTSGAQSPEQPSDQGGARQPQPPTTWSKEQPPPGQWTAPHPQDPRQAPPPPPPGPGWGGGRPPAGPGGYGGRGWGGPGQGFGGSSGWGGWGPPPAAKPGVIPLRPLGVGEILDGAVSTMRAHWRTVLGISLVVAVFTEIAVILLQGFVLDDSASTQTLNDPSASAREVGRALGDVTLSSGAVSLVVLLGTIVVTGLLTTVTSRAVLGRPVSAAEAWRDARPQMAGLFALTFLLVLMGAAIVAGGALPGILIAMAGSPGAGAPLAVLGGLGGVVVALWLLVRFSLASPALMLEKQGIGASMRRSAKLVRGSWWRVFGIRALAQVIAVIIGWIIVIPFAVLAGAFSDGGLGSLVNGTGSPGWTFLIISGIGSVIARMLTFPVTAGVTVLLYIDQRIRREALDLDLARAAGVPGHGSDDRGTVPGS